MKDFILKKIIANPLFWIGISLTFFTLHYEDRENIYSIFFTPTTYRNLFIGSGIYVSIFNIKYTKNHEKIDYLETISACIETMAIILFIWLFTLSLYIGYHEAGEMYGKILAAKYSRLNK